MRSCMQTFFVEAGEASCYAIALVDIAEEITGTSRDIVKTFMDAVDKGFIHYNWSDPSDGRNFFVENPSAFLSWMTGQKWDVSHDVANYVPRPGEFIINRWELTVVKAGKTEVHAHFRRPAKDSLFYSNCVANGSVVSTRVCRRVA